MNRSLQSQQSPCFSYLAVGIITCLILLINVSFKIIQVQSLVFAISSLLCPVISILYLIALRKCTLKEQRHLLNIALMTLYLFCIGIYVLVNLPAAEYMHNNPAYQIIFEDIPKKFFATTISFALSFYLPHLILCTKNNTILSSPKRCALLALFGGFGFFCSDFYLLFAGPHAESFAQVFIDSLMIACLVLLVTGVSYLFFVLDDEENLYKLSSNATDITFPIYQYLLCIAVAVMMMCLACEYRLIAFSKEGVLAASCVFFPVTMIISTVIGELWGYKANLKLALILIAAQLIFDTFLMGIVSLPSPQFFNLNPFYVYLMPRRLPASTLALFVAFLSNAMLLHYLSYGTWKLPQLMRIAIANICSSSLLCLVDYSLLFGGIYPYEQIVNLAVNVWEYKLVMTMLSLPVILSIYRSLQRTYTFSEA